MHEAPGSLSNMQKSQGKWDTPVISTLGSQGHGEQKEVHSGTQASLGHTQLQLGGGGGDTEKTFIKVMEINGCLNYVTRRVINVYE